MNRPSPMRRQDKAAIVELNDVWIRYNEKWVLKGVSLSCLPGEILGIVGPNGGGKTTLLNVILGLIPPEKGTVRLFGRNPGKDSRLDVGYLPQISQADRFFPVSVLDVVLMGQYNRLGLFRRPDSNCIRKAMEQLHQVNMAEQAHRPFGILSGGQQQRVHIARALASQPKLLILDEPATGIDSVAQEDFYELLAKLRDEREISAIMVSHDIGMITSHVDRVACLNREIHYHGKPEFCLSPEIQRKVFGDHMKVLLHDSACVTCLEKHRNDS